jgi:hypothetical protein
MEDAVRPVVEECRTVFEQGFRAWSILQERATQTSDLFDIRFDIQSAVVHLPAFPHGPDSKHRYGCLWAAGTSIWETSQGVCKLPPLEQHLDIPISINSPTCLTLSSCPDLGYKNWFSGGENHLGVLILA